MKYYFVEGSDDEAFLKKIIKKDDNYKIIKYAQAKNDKIIRMIKTIKSCKDEYYFLTDLDGKNKADKLKEIKKNYKNVDASNVFYSIYEIESWYLAGISSNNIEKYNIDIKLLRDTSNVTKEDFEKLFKNTREEIFEIKLNILSELDIIKAKSRNTSLKLFLDKAL